MADASAEPDGPRIVRIATLNVLHGIVLPATGPPSATSSGIAPPVDLHAVASGIASLEADVVALQEVDRGLARSGSVDQVASLAALLGWHSAFAPALHGDPADRWQRAARVDGGGPGYGVGLVSRHPIVATAATPLPGGGDHVRRREPTLANPGWDREPRIALHADVAVGDRRLRVTTTHLSYLPLRALRQLRAARAGAGGSDAAVLAGDINLPPGLARRAAGSMWHHVGGSPTYPAWAPRVQLDHVWVRGQVQVRAVSVGPQLTSDHLPVVVDLVWRDRR